MSSVLRPVRKRKKVRTLGPVDVIDRAEYAELDVDTKVELIRSLVPLGLMHVEELLDQEVTALAGARYARKDASVGGRRHGSNPGTVGLGGQRVPIRVPRIRHVAGSEMPLRSYEALHGERAVNDLLLKRVLYGISCRNYETAAEAIPGAIGLSGVWPTSVTSAGTRWHDAGDTASTGAGRSFGQDDRGSRCVGEWPRRLRCSSPQQARKSGDHTPLPVIRDRILTEVDVKQSPAQGHRVDGWALVSANRGRQASRGTAGEDDHRASPDLVYVEVAAEPVQWRQLVSANGVCHRPHQPGSQGIVEGLGYVVAIAGTRHDQPERHVEAQVEELPIEALVVLEPVIGQIKQARGFRQFLLRGFEKVHGARSLVCTTHNMLKLYRLCG